MTTNIQTCKQTNKQIRDSLIAIAHINRQVTNRTDHGDES